MQAPNKQLPGGLCLISAGARPDLFKLIHLNSAHPLNQWSSWQSDSYVRHWKQLQALESLLPFQTVVLEDATGDIIAASHSVPFFWPELPAEYVSGSSPVSRAWACTLPDGGWDAILARGVLQAKARQGLPPDTEQTGHEAEEEAARLTNAPNALAGLLVNVLPAWRDKGIADALLDNFKRVATENNLQTLVLPLRPTRKDRYPEVTTDEYLTWTEAGPYQRGFHHTLQEGVDANTALPFDPWLRKHVRMGALPVKLAPRSFQLLASPHEWRELLAADIDTYGSVYNQLCENGDRKELKTFSVDGRPLTWNPEQTVGSYTETDLWVMHSVL